jgi:hypothetical protein
MMNQPMMNQKETGFVRTAHGDLGLQIRRVNGYAHCSRYAKMIALFALVLLKH